MERIPTFDRQAFRSGGLCSRIGGGAMGGKAEGLVRAHRLLRERSLERVGGIEVAIPAMVVVGTDVFERFMEGNQLVALTCSVESDRRIAERFLSARLPADVLADLHALASEVRRPLAVRSSSRLEDSLRRPFAGIYETKMIPNHQSDPEQRFRRLVEAVKLVYASTFFRGAQTYRKAVGATDGDEAMAVMIQEVVGTRHGDRFYPDVSAVARSYSYYPVGPARPEDGVATLALGLGKTIVDGGVAWTYSPRHPRAPAPFSSPRQLLRDTQTRFWAVNMGRPPALDPTVETEYMVEATLEDAERDGTLHSIASTYDSGADRVRPGTGMDGPRVLTFAPLLEFRRPALNDVVEGLLDASASTLGTPVEIELAATLAPEPRVGFVQVRGMVTPEERVDVAPHELEGAAVLLSSERAMGNGVEMAIRDVVYARPDRFDPRYTREMADQIDDWNGCLLDAGRPYLLVGFGRWGSSDPWLGIPVKWSQVAGARVIVEATLASMDVEPSQGSHFFHNLSSFGVLYFTVPHGRRGGVDWGWLDRQDSAAESQWLRHVRLADPLEVRVDGRTGRGVVRWTDSFARSWDRPAGGGPRSAPCAGAGDG